MTTPRVLWFLAVVFLPLGWAASPRAEPPASMYNVDASHLALQGFDPVSYFPEGGSQPVPGRPEFSFEHQGVTYRFASLAHLDAFRRDPARYEPAHGGWCTYAMGKDGSKVEVDPKSYVVAEGRLFLFYKGVFSDTRKSFLKAQARLTTDADVHWRALSGEEPRLRAAGLKVPSRFSNPVIPGWYADPEIVRFGNTAWLYPTTSAPYSQQRSFDAFSSEDLTHWEKHSAVLRAEDVPWATRALWAPSVVESKGKYYFFFAANDIQSDAEVGGIGVAVADKPEGPFRDLLGTPLVPRFQHGAQPIDPFVFTDDDGSRYLIYGGWGHCNITALPRDLSALAPITDADACTEITPEGYVEGPFMFRREGRYYFMWSEGGWTGPDYAVAYATGPSPKGPFRRTGVVLSQHPGVATGAGHHSLLRLQDDQMVMAYHRRPNGETDPNHRVVCLDRLILNADGSLEPVAMTPSAPE